MKKIGKIIGLIIMLFIDSYNVVFACDPSLSDSIRYTEFAHVEVKDVDTRELYYMSDLEFVVLDVQIIKILNLKSFFDYKNGDEITISISKKVYNKVKGYNELIITNIYCKENITSLKDPVGNPIEVDIDILYSFYDSNEVNSLIPVDNGIIRINNLIENDNIYYYSAINMLLNGNFSEDLVFEDGMSVDELDQYFKLRFEKFGNRGQCDDSMNYQWYIFIIYILPAIGLIGFIGIVFILIKITKKKRL